MHICRRWRSIVFASQRSLHLQLFCTPGTPVLQTLYLWPALPIVVQYGGSPASNPPFPEDEDNIVAALKQPDRVNSISLTVTKSLLEKLSAIERPFPELENLVLLCGDDVPLTLSSAFWWGPRLRNLHLTRVAIPKLLPLLCFSTGLVDLQLHEISEVGYISPEVFVSALSGMPHLRTLSLHFLSSTPYLASVGLPPLSERVTLLALRKLRYRGTSEYLDSLAARIDTPRLCNIGIALFSEPPPMELWQLGNFISRISMHKSHRRADILFSEHAVSISFTQPDSPTCLELQVSCESFSLQLSIMAVICTSSCGFLSGIEHLHVCATRPLVTSGHDSWHDDNDRKEWQKRLYAFKSTKWAYFARGLLSTDLVIALQIDPFHLPTAKLLPALHKLCIQEPDSICRKAVVLFIRSRILSGHIIAVEYERLKINELHGNGKAFFPTPIFITH